MKTIVRTKVEKNFFELRDYEFKPITKSIRVIHCKAQDYRTHEHEGEQYMILIPAILKKGKVTNTQHSIKNIGQTYLMYGFKWKPTGTIQNDLFTVSTSVYERLRQNKELMAKLGR